MSSVSGLLVPNNFDIYAKSITTPGGGAAGPADILFSGGNTNEINVGNSINPVQFQSLIATGPNTATWQEVVLPERVQTLTNKDITSSTNSVYAASLFTTGGANVINVSSAPTPISGQILTAISGAQAEFRDPALPDGVVAEGFVEGSSIASGSYQNIGLELNLTGYGSGSFLIVSSVTGITTGNNAVYNGQAVMSFRNNAGALTISLAPGNGWTLQSSLGPTDVPKWKIGASGNGAQFEILQSTAAAKWRANYKIYFTPGF